MVKNEELETDLNKYDELTCHEQKVMDVYKNNPELWKLNRN